MTTEHTGPATQALVDHREELDKLLGMIQAAAEEIHQDPSVDLLETTAWTLFCGRYAKELEPLRMAYQDVLLVQSRGVSARVREYAHQHFLSALKLYTQQVRAMGTQDMLDTVEGGENLPRFGPQDIEDIIETLGISDAKGATKRIDSLNDTSVMDADTPLLTPRQMHRITRTLSEKLPGGYAREMIGLIRQMRRYE